jgi:hypothetical protein
MATFRAHAERDKDQIRVVLFEQCAERDDQWEVIDIAEHEDLSTIVLHLDKKHDFTSNQVLVQENDGTWGDPDCITLTEALECTI